METNGALPERVLVLGWSETTAQNGGVGIVCKHLVQQLQEAGCDVLVVHPSAQPMEDDSGPQPSQSPPSFRTIGPYMTASEFRSFAADRPTTICEALPSPIQSPIDTANNQFSTQVAAAIEETAFSPEIIHVHDWFGYEAAKTVAASTDAPIVMHVHSAERERRPGLPSSEISEHEQTAIDGADRIISVSKRSAKILRDRYDVPKDRITVIEPGDAAVVQHATGIRQFPEFTVLFLGRITRQKGPFFFLEVAKQLLAEDKGWRFLFAGEGDCLPELIEKTAELGLQNRIHFCGHVSERERAEAFEVSDLFLAPSVSEPFGLAPLEAIRFGIPAVVSRQTGISEWLPDSLLVDYWDTDGICEALRRYREDPNEAASAVSLACAATAELSSDRTIELLSQCYNKALQRKSI